MPLDRLARPGLPAPLSASAVAAAEDRLGFPLPPLLAAVYTRVADGGVGPEDGLFALLDEAVPAYLRERTAKAGTAWAWPAGVLPVLDWGCGMYAAVDCRSPHGTVLLFEPNPGDPDQAWWVDSETLEQWFEHHLNGTGWWTLAENGDDYDLRPWRADSENGA